MIENKKQNDKKKPGLLRRVFKYIGLCLLVLLLIAAVIYQAPWKIITLLTVILAACTILPKPFRKWFWLSVSAVVIALIIWIFLPEDSEGWRPYTFDKELAELEAEYAIPVEENAALIYGELFETFDIDSNQHDFFVKSKPSSRDEPWFSKDHPETARWLESQQDTIENLLQAAKKNKCIFLPIIDGHMVSSEYVKRLSRIRMCAFLLVSAANNDMAEGRTDAALEKLFCINQMAEHMKQQHVMICHLVGLAIERIALEQLNRFVIEGQPSPEHLLLISDSIIGVENNWAADWPKILDFEKLYAKNMLCSIVYEKNSEGKVRLNRGILSLTDEQLPQEFPPPTYSRRKLLKAKTIFNWFIFPSSPENITKIFDASYEKHYTIAESDYDWTIEPNQWDSIFTFITSSISSRARLNYKYLIQLAVDMSEGSYYKHYESYLKNLALRRGLWLLTAIKQYEIEHGTWPDSLNVIKAGAPAEAFIDPVNGNEFEYENHGKRFSLFAESVKIWPK